MLDLFAPGFAQTLVLLALRVGGLVLVAPVFSAKTVPPTVRTALVLVLTLLLAPMAHAAAGGRVEITPATFVTEIAVGFAIGFGGALLVAAAETAGDLMSTTMGLSGASLMDPLSGTSSALLPQVAQMFAVTVLLAADGHLVMLDALATSAREVPVGGALHLPGGLAALLTVGGTLFALGLQFAAPVIAGSLVASVALAVLTRAAPQLNVFALAFPIQIAVGLVAMVASLAFLATAAAGWPVQLETTVARVFRALAA